MSRLVQVLAWRDGLLALDDEGGFWFGTPSDLGVLPVTWSRMNTPAEVAGPPESGAGSPPRPLLGSNWLGRKIEGAADYRPRDPSRRDLPAESP